MTLIEYRDEVFNRLRTSKSLSEINGIIKEVQEILHSSDISSFNQRQFWSNLYYDFNKNNILNERQSASSLSTIVALAQQAIANHLSSIPK